MLVGVELPVLDDDGDPISIFAVSEDDGVHVLVELPLNVPVAVTVDVMVWVGENDMDAVDKVMLVVSVDDAVDDMVGVRVGNTDAEAEEDDVTSLGTIGRPMVPAESNVMDTLARRRPITDASGLTVMDATEYTLPTNDDDAPRVMDEPTIQ